MYYYIVNSAAGRGKVAQLESKIRARLDELGIRGEWAHTTGPGEATSMATNAVAKGHTTIIAVGGDDTVNEVMNGILDEKVAIGIIPTGSNNHLAKQFGIQTWQQACNVLAARRLSTFSLIAAGQQHFLSTLTLGFETDLGKRIDTGATGWKARLTQLRHGWGTAQKFESLHAKMKVDDNFTIECDLFTLSVANQKFINPLADNKLLVSIYSKPNAKQLGGYLWQLVRNGSFPLEDEATTRFIADRVVIETQPVSGIMVDGKITSRTPIAIRLTNRRVKFITEKLAMGLST